VVEAAYLRVKRLVRRRGVFLLAPPGSSRGYILERLMREGVVGRAYAYPRLAEELRARGLAVGDLPSAEELERGADRRVVVAVESSLQAVELKEKLGKRAELIYLPKYFKEAAKDVDEELLQAAEVEHRGLGEGISPKLLRPGDKELKKGRDALLALSPGAVGLRDAAGEAFGRFPFKTVSALLAELLSPALAVLAVLQAAAPSAAPLAALVGTAVGVGRKQLEDFATRLLELFAKRKEPRDKVAAGFAKLVRRALKAEPYIDDDHLEAVVDQVALEWGMDVKTFKALVRSLAALARGELVTKEELSRELAQHVKRGELKKIEEAIRQLVESRLAEIEKRLEEIRRRLDRVEKDLKRKVPIRILSVEEVEGVFKKVEDALNKVKTQVSGLLAGVKVAFVGDVEAGLLYHNFVVVGGAPRVKTRAAGGQGDVVVDVVTGGVFGRLAGEVLDRLERDGLVVLVGPHGVGKSTLAAYAAWLALWRGAADAVVSAEEVKTGFASALENLQNNTGRRFLLLYDPVPVTAYYEPRAMGEEAEKEKERVRRAVEEALSAAKRGVKALVVLPDELYRDLPPETKKALKKYVVEAVLNDVEFLHEVVRRYSGCGDSYKELAEKIAQFKGGYTLAAKYAGLWLRERGCDAGDVEKAVEETKKELKLSFAFYIRDVLLRGSGDLAWKAAVPLLLHAVFGPVPVGVTYVTKAVYEGGVWRLLTPEELKGANLESLKEDALEPIARWLAQQHEDLVEETLRDLAGLSGEEARKPYEKALGDLIKALDWARGEVLKEGDKVLAELGIQEKRQELGTALLLFVARSLAAVFKSGESRRCWRRVAFIAGHALAGYPKLPKRKQFPKGVAKTLGDSLRSCAVDAYLTIDGKIPPLSIYVVRFPYYIEVLYARDLSRIRKIREKISVLSPLADAVAVNTVKKTVEELLARWRRGGSRLAGAFYVLGLAALAAEAKVDGKTAKLLLHVAPFAIQGAAHSAVVLSVLAALRPLGEKAPHRYVVALAAASELETLNRNTVEYIYDVLQHLKDRILKAKHRWPLVEAVRAYSNLLRKHPVHIWDRLEEAVADMCRLYGEVGKHGAAAAPDRASSAQRLLDTVAEAYVLAAALEHDVLAPLVRRHCGLGDLEKEAKDVRGVLDEAAAHPEELRKIVESNADFAEWVTALSSTGDAGEVIEDLGTWFTYLLARYKLEHALDEKGELDEKKLEEAAEEFEKAAEMHRKLKQWGNYLATHGRALRARVLAAKSWEELLERAKGFCELWREAEKHREPTAVYSTKAAARLGECLVYMAASGDRERAEDLLKERRWLLNYVREVSVATRLMLKLFGVGEGTRLEEVMNVLKPRLLPEFWPALLMLAGRLQKDEALEECDELSNAQLSMAELCVDAVAAAAGNRVATERLRSVTKKIVPETHPLLGKADGRTLVEVLAPRSSQAQLAFMLLAAVEGRADAVRLHGLEGSAGFKEPLLRRLFRAVYENCGDLNSEGCRLALLKLYYLHY
jgi:KaiC/GvpD/RAD55 family RecA-like ATPase